VTTGLERELRTLQEAKPREKESSPRDLQLQCQSYFLRAGLILWFCWFAALRACFVMIEILICWKYT